MPLTEFDRIILRFVSGRPLDGRSGYPYLSRGPGRWPGWKRQALRLGTPASAAGAYVAYTLVPAYTATAAATMAALTAAQGAVSARRGLRMRRFRRTYITPTIAALRPSLGDAPIRLHVSPDLGNLMPRLSKPMSPAEVAARLWYGENVEPLLRWAPDRVWRAWVGAQRAARPVTDRLALLRRPVDEETSGPRIELTMSVPYLTVQQREYVSAVVRAKIPAGELVETVNQVGEQVRIVWKVRRRPPSHCGYADLDARFKDLKEWEFFLGLGVGKKPNKISLKEDSPHIACSAGTGAGKSVLAQLIAVQVLARGGRVVILDFKGSHRWALGLDGVDYCTTPEQMHRALLALAKEAAARNSAALHEPDDWDPGQRVFLIAEELNATMTALRDYWIDVRTDARTSPAVKAFRNLLFMGRSAKHNVFAVAQMLTANTTGGPESRENFGIRCLARYTRNNWQMLVPEAGMPRASRTLGRWQVVVRGEATETQVCYLSPAEARLFVAKHRAGVHVSGEAGQTLDGMRPANVHVDVDIPRPPAPELTLQDAINELICPWNLAAVQKRLQRARAAGSPHVPVPVGKRQRADLFERTALIAWIESELVS